MLKEQTKIQSIEERFIIRPPRMSDLDDVLELLEICDLHTIDEVEESIEILQTDWTLPNISLEENFRVVTTKNGRLIAYATLWNTDDPIVNTFAWARVHPEFEGQGIGSHLLAWSEKVSRDSIVRAPKEARFTMLAGTHSTYQPAHELLQSHGMTPLRHFFTMAIDLDQAPDPPCLPENIIIRPMQDQEELPAIVRAVEDAFQDHWGFVEQSFENQLAQWQHVIKTDPSFDQSLWFLAMDGDQIAGLSLCSPKYGSNTEMGWVQTLGVLRPWRRQGLGLALLKHSFGELYPRGKSRVGLGVDANSLTGATGLYEKAGMRPIRQFDEYEKELRPGVDLVLRTIE